MKVSDAPVHAPGKSSGKTGVKKIDVPRRWFRSPTSGSISSSPIAATRPGYKTCTGVSREREMRRNRYLTPAGGGGVSISLTAKRVPCLTLIEMLSRPHAFRKGIAAIRTTCAKQLCLLLTQEGWLLAVVVRRGMLLQADIAA